ncbi:MAG: tetratricopeptide repeat protein [Acidobacteriota bacterium]
MEPIPEAIGPYRIGRTLGRGGMGVVYHATHQESGRAVALKTVRVPSAILLGSIRREILALRGAAHPGVVGVLEEGVHDGVPWYAMELLEGTSLRALLASGDQATPLSTPRDGVVLETQFAPTGGTPPPTSDGGTRSPRRAMGLPIGRAMTIARRLCVPLAYLHGEGIVHRDLKPENVILRDGFPVLVDFGLVTHAHGPLAREVIADAVESAGTPLYMAPEQAGRGFSDARTDLYALGCIIYELVAGRPPFLGGNAREIIDRHRNATPVRLAEVEATTPVDLDLLVMSLLAKEPRERIGHADIVQNTLSRIAEDAGVVLGAAEPPGQAPAPRPYLYRSGFAGRDGPMRALSGRLAEVRSPSRRGSFVLLEGESGVGKTRLSLELAALAFRRRVAVLSCECRPGGEVLGSFGALFAAVADRCRERGPAETERILGPHRALLGPYHAPFAGLPGTGELQTVPELPHEEARRRLFFALTAVLCAYAGEQPLVLLLDDLQWADELSREWLLFLVRGGHLASLPVLLVATSRSEERSMDVESLISMLAPPYGHHLKLDRLDEDAVAEVMADMLAVGSPLPDLVRYVTRQSSGNPFFVAEYLRLAVNDDLLTRDRLGRWQMAAELRERLEGLPVPTPIRDLVSRRIDGLPPHVARWLDVAAVAGHELDVDLLAALSGGDEAAMLSALATLVRSQVLEDAPGSELRFLHDRIRDVAYERLACERRRELHGDVASALARRGGSDGASAALGRHWELAGRPDMAMPAYLAAARGASRRYALADAERHYRAYLALLGEPTKDGIAARSELAINVLIPRGANAERLFHHERACEEARQLKLPDEEAFALRCIADCLMVLGRLDEAGQRGQASLDLYAAHGSLPGTGSALMVLGRIAFRKGQLAEGERLLREAIGKLRDAGSELLADAIVDLTSAVWYQSRFGEAIELQREALELFRERGNRMGEAGALTNLATMSAETGGRPRAKELLLEAIAVLREVGNKGGLATALGNLANIHFHLAETATALELYHETRRLHRESGDRRNEAVVCSNEANLLRGEGRLDESDALYSEALAVFREVRDRRMERVALQGHGHLRTTQGRHDEAIAMLTHAVQMARDPVRRARRWPFSSAWRSRAAAGRGEEEIEIAEGLAARSRRSR